MVGIHSRSRASKSTKLLYDSVCVVVNKTQHIKGKEERKDGERNIDEVYELMDR